VAYQVLRRGQITKREEDNRLTLERKLLVIWYKLELNRDKCLGCGICADQCPKEAIEYFPAEFKGIKALTRPSIDFDTEKCVLCGECVATCPLDALQMIIEKEERVPVIEANVFATVTKKRW